MRDWLLLVALLTSLASCRRHGRVRRLVPVSAAYRVDLEAICDASARAMVGRPEPDPLPVVDTRERFAVMRAWMSAHVTSPEGQKLVEALSRHDADPTKLRADAKRARLASCKLGDEMEARWQRRRQRDEVVAICEGTVDAPLPAVATPEGRKLLQRLTATKTRGSVLRRQSQILTIMACPRANAWDATEGLEPPLPPRSIVTQSAPFATPDNGLDVDRALDRVYDRLEACGRAAVAEDALFDGTIDVRLDQKSAGTTTLRVLPGAQSQWTPEAFTCFADVIRTAEFTVPFGRVSYRVRALPEGTDTWTAAPRSRARLTMKDAKIVGGIVLESALRTLTPAVAWARACDSGGDLVGTIEIFAVVDAEGAIESVTRVSGSLPNDDGERDCVLRAMLRAFRMTTFPATDAKKVFLTFTLEFGGAS